MNGKSILFVCLKCNFLANMSSVDVNQHFLYIYLKSFQYSALDIVLSWCSLYTIVMSFVCRLVVDVELLCFYRLRDLSSAVALPAIVSSSDHLPLLSFDRMLLHHIRGIIFLLYIMYLSTTVFIVKTIIQFTDAALI